MAELADLTIEQLPQAESLALHRLLLYVTGRVHELGRPVLEAGVNTINRAAPDEELPASTASQAKSAMLRAWANFLPAYAEVLGAAMRVAASLPFGGLAVQHEQIVLPNLPVTERAFGEQVSPQIFNTRIQQIVRQVGARSMPDRVQLSGRIWRLDFQTRRQIDRVLADALANGRSAWETAQQLEQSLSFGAECPRWTSTRLKDLSKADIAAGDATGLLTGTDCDGKGVAYNALRLARTEIAAAYARTTDTLLARVPWVVGEQILTSPEHGKTDICDDVASGGENGDGVYAVGTITLPLHSQCMCIKVGVQMPPEDFRTRLQSWQQGTAGWSKADTYQEYIGGDVRASLLETAAALLLAYWLWTAEPELT